MEIIWLGHSSVRIRGTYVTLITDPFGDSVGFPMPRASADVVTVSHDHPHHSNIEAVDGDYKLLKGPGEYEIANFYITGMGTPRYPQSHVVTPAGGATLHNQDPTPAGGATLHDQAATSDTSTTAGGEVLHDQAVTPQGTVNENGEPQEPNRQVNTIFTYRAEGLTICHLGDINRPLSSRQAEDLNQVEVLIVPVGGGCTISLDRVRQLVSLIGPRIVIPVHYMVEGLKVELEPLERFLGEIGASEVNNQARLNVTATNLPRDMTVVALQRVTQGQVR